MKSHVASLGILVILALAVPAVRAPVLSEGAGLATSPGGQWQCWTPTGTVPCGYALTVAGVSPVDAWAVGHAGTIMHWNGSLWRSVASPTTASLVAIGMVSATDGWVVGEQGVILHWDGFAWNRVESPTTQYLTSVDMVSAVDGWAVGVSGVIMHWDGGAWSLVTGPTEEGLESVSMASATDGWAVGGYGTMLHWDGVRWTESSATPRNLHSVQMLSPIDGWAAGDQGTILRWDGSDWWPVTSPTTDDLYALSMAADNAGWAVGGAFHETDPTCPNQGSWSHVLLRWDGVAWSRAVYPAGSRLFHVAMISAEDGWASGENFSILHWNGSGWDATTPYVDRSWALNDIAMASAVDGWAVGGDYYNAQIIHWDGVTWTPVESPVYRALHAIDLLAPDDGWAVGEEGEILHWDGHTWSQVTSPVTRALYDVDMVSPTDGWAVGDYPGVILRWNGVHWSLVDDQFYRDLYGVDMVSATDGWIVGEDIILHWNGQTWSALESSTKMSAHVDGMNTTSAKSSPDAIWVPTFTEYNYALDMVSTTDGWIVGGHDWGYEGWWFLRRHWDGVSWSLEEDWGWPLRAVTMVSATDGWAVGGGTWRDPKWGCTYSGWEFMRWDGVNWTDVNNPSGGQLNAVAMVSATDGWAVGNGAILRYTGVAPTYRTYLPIVTR